jgi:hypothetical protein
MINRNGAKGAKAVLRVLHQLDANFCYFHFPLHSLVLGPFAGNSVQVTLCYDLRAGDSHVRELELRSRHLPLGRTHRFELALQRRLNPRPDDVGTGPI